MIAIIFQRQEKVSKHWKFKKIAKAIRKKFKIFNLKHFHVPKRGKHYVISLASKGSFLVIRNLYKVV